MCCQCFVDSSCNVLPVFGGQLMWCVASVWQTVDVMWCIASVWWTVDVMCCQCLADSWYDVLPVFGGHLMWCVAIVWWKVDVMCCQCLVDSWCAMLPVFGGHLMCCVASVCGTFDVLCCQCLAESQCICCVHVLQPLLSTWWRKCCTQMRGLSRMMVRLNAYLIIAPLSPTLFICCYCGSETNVKPVSEEDISSLRSLLFSKMQPQDLRKCCF